MQWWNTQTLTVFSRAVMLAICELAVISDTPGVFRPDPDLTGPYPLPKLIAIHMCATDEVDQIAESLDALSRLRWIDITDRWEIVIRDVQDGRVRVKAVSAAAANVNNGLRSAGRPRKGETRDSPSYIARKAEKEQRAAAQRTLPLMSAIPGSSGTGEPVPPHLGVAEYGERLAQRLRAQIRLHDEPMSPLSAAPMSPESETQIETQNPNPETETETQTETQTAIPVSQSGFSGFSRTEEEEEESKIQSLESNENPSLPPPPPRANAGATETQNPKPETQNRKPKTETETQMPLPPSAAAINLAKIGGTLWNWSAQDAKTAPQVMQKLIDRFGQERVEHEVTEGKHPARGPTFYFSRLETPVREPQQAQPPREQPPREPPPPLDPRITSYPPWRDIGRADQLSLHKLLGAMDMQDGTKARNRLMMSKSMLSMRIWDQATHRFPLLKQIEHWREGEPWPPEVQSDMSQPPVAKTG